MYLVVVTGAIGSGKSAAVDYLASQGARVVSLDKIGHDVLESDEEVACRLVDAFGSGILNHDGTISRKALAAAAFATPDATHILNNITHPAILARAERIINQAQTPCLEQGFAAPLMVVEVPLPHQATPLLEIADEVLCIVATDELRLQRLQQRGLSAQDATARMAQQPTQEAYKACATLVIFNNGTLKDLEQVLHLWWQQHKDTNWQGSV